MRLPDNNNLTLASSVLAFAIALCADASFASGQAFESPRLLKLLDAQVSVVWQGQTLQDALGRLSKASNLDLWLDRRVDKQLNIELTARNQTAREVLSKVVEPHGLVVVSFDELVYVGPKTNAQELRTLAAIARQTVSRMPPVVQRRWLQRQSVRWRHLSEPRQLVDKLVDSIGVELVNPGAIPHDLWAERDSGPLTIVDQIVLLLSGFDLTCEFSANGRQMRVAAVSRPVHITNDYRLSPRQTRSLDALLSSWPDAVTKPNRGGIRLHASWEAHESVRRLLEIAPAPNQSDRQKTDPRRPGDRKVYTLQLEEQPLGGVLDQLSAQLSIEVQWSEELDQAALRRRRISCNVTNVDREGLLSAVLKSAALAHRPTSKGIVVVAPK